jgi:spermidine synthase
MFVIALLVVTLSGFIALSYEILWFRVFSFVTGGTAPSFGVVLSVFLLGIALGSLWSRRFCSDGEATGTRAHLRLPAWLLAISSFGGFVLPAALSWIVVHTSYILALPLVALVAGLNGAVLPLVAHFAIAPDNRAGERLSYLYLGNIIGSSTGSLFTGFVLLNNFSLATASLILLCVGMLTAVALFVVSMSGRSLALAAGGCLLVLAGSAAAHQTIYHHFYERLLFKEDYSGQALASTVETRSGVINVTTDGQVFGGGVYDGIFNTGLVNDRNMLIRPYALSAIHSKPKDILVIGLASGSWTQVLAHHPDAERIVVIEINPGYLNLIEKYPEVKSLLTNPKVDIQIDDGRRWLVANPGRMFDAVVMNTSWHWRGHSTNLLSTEFMELLRSRLNEGGVLGFNTTGSHTSQKTACEAFGYGFRMLSFMWVSDSKLELNRERWRKNLTAYRIDGEPVFDVSDAAQRERLEDAVNLQDKSRPGTTREEWFLGCETIRERYADREVITDDNMATEWYRPWYRAD